MKTPPPPCELLVIPKPSMLEGVHQRLLLFGLVPWLVPQLVEVNSVVPVGKPPSSVGAYWLAPWKSTPLASTVIAEPSRAPISEGSCSSSARWPCKLASHPTVASSGSRSTAPSCAVAQLTPSPLLSKG